MQQKILNCKFLVLFKEMVQTWKGLIYSLEAQERNILLKSQSRVHLKLPFKVWKKNHFLLKRLTVMLTLHTWKDV